MNWKRIYRTLRSSLIKSYPGNTDGVNWRLTGFARGLLKFAGFAVLLLCLNGFWIYSIVKQLNPRYELPNEMVLTLNLSGVPDDVNNDISPVNAFLSDTGLIKTAPLNHLGVLKHIERAADDDRVKALVLMSDPGEGLITANDYELREALKKFSKPIYMYTLGADQRGLYMSTVADKIFVHPMAVSFIGGFASQQPYFKALLDKVGVSVQVVKAGKYKSAVEPFIENEMSAENTFQLTALLDQSWNTLINAYSLEAKNQTELNYLARNTPVLNAEELVKNGLATEILSQNAFKNRIKKEFFPKLNEEELQEHTISMTKYSLDKSYERPKQDEKEKDNHVAVVYLNGTIQAGSSTKKEIGSNTVIRQLVSLRNDKNVKAIVLRLNTPGGSALASELIAEEIRTTQLVKPVYVSMGNVTASGGYWITTAAKKAYASPTTITGSIGVFGLLPNFETTAEKLGVKIHTVKTHPFADITSSMSSKSAAELALYQKQVDETYNDFLYKVGKFRGLTKAAVNEIAQGHVWAGQAAMERQLLDGLETLPEVLNRTMAESKTTQYKEYFYVPSFSEQLHSDISQFQSLSTLANTRILTYDPTCDQSLLKLSTVVSEVTQQPLIDRLFKSSNVNEP